MTKEINEQSESDFEQLLNESSWTPGDVYIRPGDDVRGTVVQISGEQVFIDYGGKAEGWAETAEFTGEDGTISIKIGDEVTLKCLEYGRSGAHLGTRLRESSADGAGMSALEDAYENGLAVDGLVKATNKGGFEVETMGVRAFCPVSQIDIHYCEEPESFVEQTLSFRIMEFDRDDKRVVLSRRALLEEEREKEAEATRQRLETGENFTGVVRKLMPYGAFVDFGGLEGFVHVSEVAHERIEDPAEKLSPGQTVDVQVISIKTDEKGKERIGLSIRALIPDPWETGLPFGPGDTVSGVVRNIQDYGAFVEVAPGVEGLLHISEIARERIGHPSERLTKGEVIDVYIKDLDTERRRVLLSLRALLAPPVEAEAAVDSSESRSGNVIRRRKAENAPASETKDAPEASASEQWADAGIHSESDETDAKAPVIRTPKIGLVTTGTVGAVMPYGLFVDLPELGPKARGLLHISELSAREGEDPPRDIQEGDAMEVEIIRIDERGRLALSHRSVLLRREREEVARVQEKMQGNAKMGTLGDLFKNIKLDK